MICHIPRDDERKALYEDYPLYDPTKEDISLYNTTGKLPSVNTALGDQITRIDELYVASKATDAPSTPTPDQPSLKDALDAAFTLKAKLSSIADQIAVHHYGGSKLTGASRSWKHTSNSVDSLGSSMDEWASRLTRSSFRNGLSSFFRSKSPGTTRSEIKTRIALSLQDVRTEYERGIEYIKTRQKHVREFDERERERIRSGLSSSPNGSIRSGADSEGTLI